MLKDELQAFTPYNAQEQADRLAILHYLETVPEKELFSKSSPAHFTVSTWIADPSRTQVLMVFHNIFRSWSWAGGHAPSPKDLQGFAVKAALKETGLRDVRLVSDGIYSLEIIACNGYMEKKEYVPSHLHLNLTYLLEADDQEILCIDTQENSGVKWFDLRRAAMQPNGGWIRSIYRKLNEKLCFYL